MSLFKVKKKMGGKNALDCIKSVKNAHAKKYLERIQTVFLWCELALYVLLYTLRLDSHLCSFSAFCILQICTTVHLTWFPMEHVL